MSKSPIDADYLANRVMWRCEEYGDCCLWTGARNPRGPVVSVKNVEYPLRKAVWECTHDESAPPGMVVTTTCREHLCLNPDHVILMTRAQLNRRTLKTGNHKLRLMNIAIARRKASPLSDEAVRAIRLDGERAPDAAAKHGVSVAYVYMLRANKFRRELSTPFAGLGAR
jgi:hypothetical protein